MNELDWKPIKPKNKKKVKHALKIIHNGQPIYAPPHRIICFPDSAADKKFISSFEVNLNNFEFQEHLHKLSQRKLFTLHYTFCDKWIYMIGGFESKVCTRFNIYTRAWSKLPDL